MADRRNHAGLRIVGWVCVALPGIELARALRKRGLFAADRSRLQVFIRVARASTGARTRGEVSRCRPLDGVGPCPRWAESPFRRRGRLAPDRQLTFTWRRP